MANRKRGEVGFTAAGQNYTLLFSINAICAVEESFGKPIGEVGAALQGDPDDPKKSIRVSDIRTLFHAALQDNHPDVDLRKAGDIMNDVGAQQSGELLGQAFKAAFPEANAGGGANPPAARGKSRTGSTS